MFVSKINRRLLNKSALMRCFWFQSMNPTVKLERPQAHISDEYFSNVSVSFSIDDPICAFPSNW